MAETAKKRCINRYKVIGVLVFVCCLCVGGLVDFSPGIAEVARRARARRDLKALDDAVTAYFVKHSRYPDSLETLTIPHPIDNSPPLLNKEALIDPWNRPYEYDTDYPGHSKTRPRIQSCGPPGGLPLSNWDADK